VSPYQYGYQLQVTQTNLGGDFTYGYFVEVAWWES
jgi:hypothetical protein